MTLPTQGERMKLLPATVLVVSCALVSGCGLYIVKAQEKVQGEAQGGAQETGQEKADVGGIPFLTRTAVTYQVTKLIQTRWKIQYVMKVDGEEYRAPAVPFDMLPSADGRAALLKINSELVRSGAQLTPESFRETVEKLVSENVLDWHKCGERKDYDGTCAISSDMNSRLISNALVVKTEISDVQHYINVRRPLVGKASASVEIASDGTLTKSTGEVESKTVETIASIISFTDYAKKVLKLGEYSIKSGDGDNARQIRRDGAGRSLDTEISVSYEVTPEPWLYVLQSRVDKAKGLQKALSYGTSGVELVEASKIAAPPKKDEQASKGWSISGTVIPPDAKGK